MTKTNSLNLVRVAGISVAFTLASLLTVGFAHADVLNRQLDIGMSGSDVTALQAYLATDPSLYPQGLVTGYFGTLTSAAVSNFQSRNGIANVGRVGPITLAALNSRMSGVPVSTNGAPLIYGLTVTAGTNNANVMWNTNEPATGLVYFSTNPLSTYENANSVTVSGNTAMTDMNYRSSQNVSLANLQSNTIYYYLVYTTDQQGNVSVSWPITFRTNN